MKRACVIAIIGLLGALILAPAWGQTQADLNEASAKEWKNADEALNVTYQQLLGRLDDEGRKKLQAAERAWVRFRDAECESQTDDCSGGSIMPLIYNTCAKRLTEARTAELKDRLKELTTR